MWKQSFDYHRTYVPTTSKRLYTIVHLGLSDTLWVNKDEAIATAKKSAVEEDSLPVLIENISDIKTASKKAVNVYVSDIAGTEWVKVSNKEVYDLIQYDIKTSGKHVIYDEHINIADTDRYASDRFDCYISLAETHLGLNVSLQINAAQLGIASSVMYWFYEFSERDKAVLALNRLVDGTKKISDRVEYERIPFANIGPMIRHMAIDVDVEHREQTGIFSVKNSFHQQIEPDWRVSIYGNRYPEHTSGNKTEYTYRYPLEK